MPKRPLRPAETLPPRSFCIINARGGDNYGVRLINLSGWRRDASVKRKCDQGCEARYYAPARPDAVPAGFTHAMWLAEGTRATWELVSVEGDVRTVWRREAVFDLPPPPKRACARGVVVTLQKLWGV